MGDSKDDGRDGDGTQSMIGGGPLSVIDQIEAFFQYHFIKRLLCEYLISKEYIAERKWLPRALPYMCTIAWINFNTWGMLSAVTPFAVEYSTVSTSGASSSENLSIAYQLAAVCLLCGDFSTTKFKLPFNKCLLLFTILVFVIYLAASDLTTIFHTSVAAPFIIIIYCCSRFVEAHLVTSTYRVIATDFSVEERVDASQAVGTADQFFTMLGAIVSTLIVSQISKC